VCNLCGAVSIQHSTMVESLQRWIFLIGRFITSTIATSRASMRATHNLSFGNDKTLSGATFALEHKKWFLLSLLYFIYTIDANSVRLLWRVSEAMNNEWSFVWIEVPSYSDLIELGKRIIIVIPRLVKCFKLCHPSLFNFHKFCMVIFALMSTGLINPNGS